MMKYIKCSGENPNLNGAEDFAVEVALNDIKGYIPTAVRNAVEWVNNANAEPEYAGEDFYLEEADFRKVLNYVKGRLGK